MRALQLLPESFLNRKLGKIGFPLLIVGLVVAGLLSPLFDLHSINGLPSARIYSQHLYFDAIAGLGGYYAAGMCQHWYHKIPVMIIIDLITTALLVMLVG